MNQTFELSSPRSLDDLLKRNHTILGGIVNGIDGQIIDIQARAVRKVDKILRKAYDWRELVRISGMAKNVTREALDRITGAFLALRIPVTPVEILVNLTPPDLNKDGTWLDLPLAIILLQAAGFLPDFPDHLESDFVLIGEIGLHGEIRRVPGALSIALKLRSGQHIFIPTGNEKEVALIRSKPGHESSGIYSFGLLEHVIGFFSKTRSLSEHSVGGKLKFTPAITRAPDFGRVKGQTEAKKAALIAAAGGHNILLFGPPGEGKSLLASAIPGIMPQLSDEEKVEITKIYSAAGELERDGMIVNRRPYRVVQSTASKQALIGGGTGIPKPGAITLAHLGILFLDEFAEFATSVLDALRQSMETGSVTLTKAGYSATYPARFTLVAAMNPCPCGYAPSEKCTCSEKAIARYLSKISGPIVDRIDLHVELKPLSVEERFASTADVESSKMIEQVESARELQRRRYQGTNIPFNAAIPGGQVFDYCHFTENAFETLKSIVENGTMSTRTMDRIAKVSRTIADLANSTDIETKHVEQSANYFGKSMLRKM